MSTRYVWSKWNLTSSTKYSENRQSVSGSEAGGQSWNGMYIYGSDNGKAWLSYKFDSNTGKFALTDFGYAGTGDTVYFSEGNNVFSGKWVNANDEYGLQTPLYNAIFPPYTKIYSSQQTIYNKGSTSYGNVSSASSGAYPANSYSGSYWYVSVGSDNIDPTSVTYPTTIFKNQKVTITVSPRSNTYGGTISYKYEYTINGNTWTVLNSSTTQTTAVVTIPDNATVFQARVTAMDNMGFTSTTAVSGSQVTVYDIDPISVSYNEDELQTGNELILSIVPANSGYTGTIFYVVQTNVNGTGWQNTTEVSSVNIPITIPSDAISWAVRVQAKTVDYTSPTYVYGNEHETGVPVKQGVGFNVLPENRHLGYIGSNKLMEFFVSTNNDSSYTCAITLNGETISSTVLSPGLQTLVLDQTKWAGLSSADEHTITIAATCDGKSITREYKFWKFVYDPSTLPGLLDGIAEAIKLKRGTAKSFWGYKLPMEILKITNAVEYITAYIDVKIPYTEGMKVMAVSITGQIYSMDADQSGTTRLEVSEIGDYLVSAAIGSVTSEVKKVSISADGETKNVTLSFISVNVTTATGALVTATLNNSEYSTIAENGTAEFYLPSKGNWNINASSGTLNNAEVVPITEYATYDSFVPLYDTVFSNNSWSDIQKATQTGLASSYWEVGDSKAVILNGGVDGLNFNNETYYVYILGFDHNSIYEGRNTLHLAFGKTNSGVQIAFKGFPMNTAVAANSWESSSMRIDLCSRFLELLPEDLRSVITPAKKYTQNNGEVTMTSDAIWLLSSYEVMGQIGAANAGEANCQQQYAYYENGNSRIRNGHIENQQAISWWLRSQAKTGENWCCVDTSGALSTAVQTDSIGFAPCFQIS